MAQPMSQNGTSRVTGPLDADENMLIDVVRL